MWTPAAQPHIGIYLLWEEPSTSFSGVPGPRLHLSPPPRTAYRHLRDATFDLVLWRPCLPLPPHTTCETQPSTLFSGV